MADRLIAIVQQPMRSLNARLIKLERDVFLGGCERAFLLFMDACCFCKGCTGDRRTCNTPRMARPAPEAMAVDVYTTVRRFGFPIPVRTAYEQKMDRYALSHGALIGTKQEEKPCPISQSKPASPWRLPLPQIWR